MMSSDRLDRDAERIRSRYQSPSTVSPNNTAPTSGRPKTTSSCRCRPGSASTLLLRSPLGEGGGESKKRDAGTAAFGGEHRYRVMGLFTGKMRGERARLFVSRFDKSVTDPAITGALSDRVNAAACWSADDRRQESPRSMPRCRSGEFDIRANAGRDHHKIGFNLRAAP